MRFLFTLICLSALSLTASAYGFVDLLPSTSAVDTAFTRQSFTARLDSCGIHRIEGLWDFEGAGALIAIERAETAPRGPFGYRMVMVSSPDRLIRRGTVMGHIEPTPKPDTYNARIYTEASGSTLSMAKRFTLTLSDDGTGLTFEQFKNPITVNLWRLLPYLWRYTVYPTPNPKEPIKGCVKVYPNPQHQREPVYL